MTMRVAFELTGTTPLLMHNDDVEAADGLDHWRKDPKNKNLSKPGDDRSPAWTWQTYLYSDGKFVSIPSQNLMVCLRQAGTRKIMQKQKTYKEITQSGIVMDSEYMEFRAAGEQIEVSKIKAFKQDDFQTQSEKSLKLGFRLFCKRAPIGKSKHVRVRPRFESWLVRGTLKVQAAEITFPILQELFDIAANLGLCDWRPGCKTPGPYGMFLSKLKLI